MKYMASYHWIWGTSFCSDIKNLFVQVAMRNLGEKMVAETKNRLFSAVHHQIVN